MAEATCTQEGLNFLVNSVDISPSDLIDQFADFEGAAHANPGAAELQYNYYTAYFLALFLENEL